jgi:hypothetical protein
LDNGSSAGWRRRECSGTRFHLAFARDQRKQCEKNRGQDEHNAIESGSDLTISHDVSSVSMALDTKARAMETYFRRA